MVAGRNTRRRNFQESRDDDINADRDARAGECNSDAVRGGLDRVRNRRVLPLAGAASARVMAVTIGLIGGAYYLLRMRKVGVYGTATGIRVVNPFTSRSLSWDQIVRFRVGAHGMSPRMGIADLTGGDHVGLWAIQGPSRVVRRGNQEAEQAVEALNELLSARMSDHGDGGQASSE